MVNSVSQLLLLIGGRSIVRANLSKTENNRIACIIGWDHYIVYNYYYSILAVIKSNRV